LARFKQFLLPLAVTASLLVVFVPLPGQLMDLLLAANITVSVVVLMTTMFVRTPLEFSLFPSLLLTTTLARLVLNVATTRLILTEAADRGVQAAGGVVAGFGQFVAGDNIVVGLVIFAIIVLIQFLVITKGATRISEVAARFALDGMPGRQLAIDADFNAGVIDENEARQRRMEVSEQADFYGSMDGASKFVRGDALAGVAITAVNILGGLFIGIFQNGMGVSEAMSVFTRLTIGDGLVSQLPAFFIAVAAGLLTTRGSRPTDFTVDFLRQTLGHSSSLWMASVFLLVLAMSPLPTLPLLGLAILCAVTGWRLSGPTSDDASTQTSATETPQERTGIRSVEEFLKIDPLEVELGIGLIRLADVNRGGDLLERITRLRNGVAQQLGIVLPKVRIRDNMALEDRGFRINVLGTPVRSGTIYPQRIMAIENEKSRGIVDGIPGRDPRTNYPSLWIQTDQAEEAEALGYDLMPPTEVLLEQLASVAQNFAHELLTRDGVGLLLDQLRTTAPGIVDELVPDLLRLGEIQRVLQNLLREGVSIRQLSVILETLGDAAPMTRDPESLTAAVRRRLARTLAGPHIGADGRLYVLRLDPRAEAELIAAAKGLSAERPAVLVDQYSEWAAILEPVVREAQRWVAERPQPILLVPAEIRRFVFQTLATQNLTLPVLAYDELPVDAAVETVAIINHDAVVAA